MEDVRGLTGVGSLLFEHELNELNEFMELFNWKRYRIVRTDSRIYPWKIEERYTLFFFLHWWNTPSFAPPHRFEKPDDAMNKIIEEIGDRANVEFRTDIIKED